MKKRLLSLLLVLSMLLAVTPLTVGATDSGAQTGTISGGTSNPLYGEVYTPTFEGTAAEASSPTKNATFVSPEIAAEQLRDAMVNRQSNLTLYVTYSGDPYHTGEWVDSLVVPMALSEEYAVGLTAGDYLRWSWREYAWAGSYNGNQYTINLELRYYTTYQEEQEFLNRLDQVMRGLGLDDLTDYGKYSAIYRYVTSHVAYDYAGLEAYEWQEYNVGQPNVDRSYFGIYTAYAAMIKGKSVCQGYATMFYAMCRWAGLPVRVVTGSNHAWNIVKVEGRWYNVDSTWDDENGENQWDWFLLGSDNFNVSGHTREEPYNQEPFLSQYPVGTADYVPVTPYWDVWDTNYHAENIALATELGLLNGVGDHRFGSLMTMQRGMLVTMLWRIAGSPKVGTGSGFPDVSADKYYAEPVTWAVKNGVVTGFQDQTFHPEENVSREQMVAILYRFAELQGYSTDAFDNLKNYTDRQVVQEYALPAMEWAVGAGIIKGITETVLGPAEPTTREQLATILIRFVHYYDLA